MTACGRDRPRRRDENGLLAGYVFVDIAGRDIGSWVDEAKRSVAQRVALPAGYALQWSGQYENLLRVKQRLKLVIPLTLLLIVVLLGVPFSAVGAIWLLFALGYNVSIATWVGLIALMGLDAETGVFMLLFLDLAWNERVRAGLMTAGAGADMMKRVAAPMIGGLATSFLLELLVYPAVYGLWRERSLPLK